MESRTLMSPSPDLLTIAPAHLFLFRVSDFLMAYIVAAAQPRFSRLITL